MSLESRAIVDRLYRIDSRNRGLPNGGKKKKIGAREGSLLLNQSGPIFSRKSVLNFKMWNHTTTPSAPKSLHLPHVSVSANVPRTASHWSIRVVLGAPRSCFLGHVVGRLSSFARAPNLIIGRVQNQTHLKSRQYCRT